MKTKIAAILNKKIELSIKKSFIQPNILSADWTNEVFKNHNKEYGAFQLRMHYRQNIAKALTVSFSIIILVIIISLLMRNNDNLVVSNYSSPLKIVPGVLIYPSPPTKIIESRIKNQIKENAPVIFTNDTNNVNHHEKEQLKNPKAGNGSDTSVDDNSGKINLETSGSGNTNGAGRVIKDSAVTWVPEMPEFPGGMDALNNFISKNVKTNNEWRESGTDGKIIYEFTVGRDGKINNVKIIRDGVNFGIAELNLSIFYKMPIWNPGKNNGNTVSVLYRLPIKFVKE